VALIKKARLACLIVIVVAVCRGQSSSLTVGSSNGLTPPAIQPGAPSGSYALTGFESVNPFNGKLNVAIPLLKISAQSVRTEAGYTMTWPVDGFWDVSTSENCNLGPDGGITCYDSTLISDSGWNGSAAPGLSPGTMWARSSGDELGYCFFPTTNSTYYYSNNTTTRLTFTHPDGTETEFVDTGTRGQPQLHNFACGPGDWAGQNRGRTFVATDGSGARFTSSQDIFDIGPGFVNSDYPVCGTLQFTDGTTYTIGYPTTCSVNSNGLVTSIRDRNGNLFTLSYDSLRRLYQVIDPLGRQTGISYASAVPSWIQITDTSNRVTTLNFDTLQNLLRSGETMQTPEQLFPTLQPPINLSYGHLFLSSIVYPNNSTMSFRYNSYGEVARVDLPTGGAFEYDWVPGVPTNVVQLPSDYPQIQSYMIYRRVGERRVYNSGNVLEQVQDYTPSESCSSVGVQPGYPQQCTTTVTVAFKSATNADLGSETHSYFGAPSCGPYPNCSVSGTPPQEVFWLKFFSQWTTGRESRTTVTGSGGGVLKTEQMQWQQRPCTEGVCWFPDVNADTAPAHDSRTIQTISALGSAVSSQAFCFDDNNNRTDLYEYDNGYSSGMLAYCQPSTSWIRHTHTDFNGAYTSLNMVRLPSGVQISSPSGTTAQTNYSYDDYGELPLTTYSSPIQHHASFGATYTTRGNLTKTSKWLNTTGSYLVDKATYDILGNVVQTTDPRSYSTTYTFDGTCGYSLPTTITNALNQSASLLYDCGLGQPSQYQDPNLVITKYTYESNLLRRLKQVDRAFGTTEQTTTVYKYIDTPGAVAVEADQDVTTTGDGLNVSKTLYDGLGRLTQTQLTSDPEGTDYVDTTYDARGRVYSVSNPHRSAASSTDGTTYHYYDALGRSCVVVPPDGTNLSPGTPCSTTNLAGDVVTVYAGGATAVVDEGNGTQSVERISQRDALGRLISVCEVSGATLIGSGGTPGACGQDISGTGFLTPYKYDALGNLLQVNQSGIAPRSFSYDSLSRLVCASNPENSWAQSQITRSALRKTVAPVCSPFSTRNTTFWETCSLRPILPE